MFAIAMWLAPKPKITKRNPLGLDDFDIPTAEEGRPLAVVFGKRRYSGPNVIWYGDLRVVAVKDKIKTGLFSSKSVTVGYKYYLGMHMILGYSRVDGIKQIIVGEKVVWPTPNEQETEASDGATSATVDAGAIFGGDQKEGGVSGTVSFAYGDYSQTQNAYLVSKLGANVPAFRGQTGVVLETVYLGTSGYLKPWAFLWKRTDHLISGDVQWYPAKANIGDDSLNVAHVIREILTDSEAGLGYNVAYIDDTNFKSVADTLYTEGFGVSLNWDNTTSCEDLIENMLAIIDGALIQDQTTGLFQLKLAREDYTPEALTIYDENDIAEVTEFVRPGFGEVASRVVVNWTEIYYNETRPAMAEDVAVMLKQQGNVVETSFDYQAIVDGDLATNIANRELKQATSMLATMKLKCLKTMAGEGPLSVFKISWAKLGLTEVTVRVMGIDYGEPSDNYITMDVTEDVFGVAYNIYSNPPDSLWTNPISNPVDATNKKVIESPYYELYKQYNGSSLLDSLDNDATFMLASADAPSSDVLGCELLVEDYTGSGYVSEGMGVFTPSATLVSDLAIDGAQATNVDLQNSMMLEAVEVGTYALIDSELVVIEAIDVANEEVTFGRAILDTIPAAHSAGARIWFLGSLSNFIDREYTNGDSPRVKFLTQTGNGVLAEGSANYAEPAAFDSRMIRPYVPARLLINGSYYPEFFTGQPTLSWRHRDRTNATQLSTIVRHTTDANYGPEVGTTYTLYIYDEDNGLVRTETGLTGTSYTYSEVNERADCSLGAGDPLNSTLRFVLKAVRGGYDSFQQYDVTIERSLLGSVTATVTVSGDLDVLKAIVGDVAATVTTTGDLSIRGELLKGEITILVTTTGYLEGELELSGTSEVTVTSTGNLTMA